MSIRICSGIEHYSGIDVSFRQRVTIITDIPFSLSASGGFGLSPSEVKSVPINLHRIQSREISMSATCFRKIHE